MDSREQQNQGQKPGLVQRAADFLEADRKKWGGMSPGAFFRLGLAELREAFSFGGNVAQPTPLGMYGTLTPGEVGAAREDGSNLRQMEEEPLRASDIARDSDPRGLGQGQDNSFSRPSDIARDSGAHGSGQGQDNTFSRPSDIARDRSLDGADQGQSKGHEKPGEIARDNSPAKPEQDHGQEHDRDMGRGR